MTSVNTFGCVNHAALEALEAASYSIGVSFSISRWRGRRLEVASIQRTAAGLPVAEAGRRRVERRIEQRAADPERRDGKRWLPPHSQPSDGPTVVRSSHGIPPGPALGPAPRSVRVRQFPRGAGATESPRGVTACSQMPLARPSTTRRRQRGCACPEARGCPG